MLAIDTSRSALSSCLWLLALPEEELYAEPDDDDDLEVEEGVLDLVLELVVLDGGEHAQAQAQEDDHKAARVREKEITCVIVWYRC